MGFYTYHSQVDTQKNGKYIVSEKGGKIIIKMPKQYINKFTYEYESSFFSNSLLHVKKDNIYDNNEKE